MISRRSRDLAGKELVVLVEGQPPYVQFGKYIILVCFSNYSIDINFFIMKKASRWELCVVKMPNVL